MDTLKDISISLGLIVTGGLLLCVLSAYAGGGSVIVGGSSPTHLIGTGVGNVRGRVVPLTYTNYSAGRFTIWNTNQDVVVDNDRGLTWTRDANIGGTMAWSAASNYCIALTFGGFTNGWRLPNLAEFSKWGAEDGLLYDNTIPALPAGHPFTNAVITEGAYYWTSQPGGEAGSYFGVSAYDGNLSDSPPTEPYYAWPVRN